MPRSEEKALFDIVCVMSLRAVLIILLSVCHTDLAANADADAVATLPVEASVSPLSKSQNPSDEEIPTRSGHKCPL